MRLYHSYLRRTAIAALLGFPLAIGPAVAQQTNSATTGTQQQDPAQQQSNQPTGSAGNSDSGQQSGAGKQGDSVVATVGETEIRGSDVMTVVGMLPPQIQSQPPEMLLPMALEQLILRELILEKARSENLADDPEVQAMKESSATTAQDDAMVQIWLNRQLEGVVTDEAVQQAYDQAKSQDQNVPPLEQVRPQIEQFLRQQAIRDIGQELRQGADIVFYDATGRPVPQGNQGQSSGNSGGQSGSGSDMSGTTGGTSSSELGAMTNGQSGSASDASGTGGTTGSESDAMTGGQSDSGTVGGTSGDQPSNN